MDVLVGQFKWVMLLGGVLTCSMWLAVAAPQTALRLLVGEAPSGELPTMLARCFGVMVGLNGLMLIWGAFHPEVRPVVLTYAALGKAAFVALVAPHARWRRKATVALVVDGLLVVLFAAYLLAAATAA
jgi:hypothetical protein